MIHLISSARFPNRMKSFNPLQLYLKAKAICISMHKFIQHTISLCKYCYLHCSPLCVHSQNYPSQEGELLLLHFILLCRWVLCSVYPFYSYLMYMIHNQMLFIGSYFLDFSYVFIQAHQCIISIRISLEGKE